MKTDKSISFLVLNFETKNPEKEAPLKNQLAK
jgi:hypothetical protein